MNGLEIDQKRVVKETKALLATVDFYEQLLSKQRYIAGDVRFPCTFDFHSEMKFNKPM